MPSDPTEIQTFRHSDGHQVDLRFFVKNGAKESLLFLPALGVWGSWYDEFLTDLMEKGINCICLDWRGQASSNWRPSRKQDWGYERLVLDCQEVFEYLRSSFPEHSLSLGGHSLGGQMACLMAARWPQAVSKLVLIATSMVWWRGYSGLMGIAAWNATWIFPLVANLRGFFPGKSIGFGGKEARTIMKDWGRNGRNGKYLLHHSDFDYETAFQHLKPDIFALSFDKDRFVTVRAMDLLIGKIQQPGSVTRFHETGKAHGFKKLGHFNWVKKPAPWSDMIKKWFEEIS